MSRKVDEEYLKERRKKVKELYNQGKKRFEIASVVGVSNSTITSDIKYLLEKGEIEEKLDEEKIERLEKTKKLYNEGKTRQEIRDELNVSITTVSNDINYLIDQGEITIKTTTTNTIKLDSEKVKKLCNNFYGQKRTLKKLSDYISQCKIELENNELKKEDIEAIKEAVLIINTYNSLVFYIKVCLKFGQAGEALRFANGQINNEKFTPEQKKKMKEIQSKIKQSIKIYKAKKALRNGQGIQEAIIQSGLSESEVIKINRELLQKNTEEKDNDENNSDEEPKR